MNVQIDSICRLAELGILVAIADGQFATEEKAAIKTIVSERIHELRPLRSDLPAVNRTFDRVRKQNLSQKDAVLAAKKVCIEIVKYDTDNAEEAAFELALRVVAADGIVKKEEEHILRVIEKALHIDALHGAQLRDLHLRLVHIQADSDEAFFDIDAADSLEDRRTSARNLYRTWSGRVVLQDLNKRQRAKENVRRLGRLLASYDRTSNH